MRDHSNVTYAATIEQILREADALFRQCLKDRGIELPYLVMVATLDQQVVLQGNVSADLPRSFGDALNGVAAELAISPTSAAAPH